MAKLYTMSPLECDILDAGKENINIPMGYFFSQNPGVELGWQLDANFEDDKVWQLDAVMCKQPRLIIVGGFASGKTLTVAMGSAMTAPMYDDFKFLNIAPTYKQSKVMYDAIMTRAKGAPFEKLIWKSRERPSPAIVLRFIYRGKEMTATLDFWSGYDSRNLLTAEVDWLNIEQAESFDDLDDVLVDAGTRVRGVVGNRVRMGRLSMTANSDDNPTLWQQVDYGEIYPEDYHVAIVSTRDNKNVTEEQLKMFLRDIPQHEVDQKIDGGRPVGKGVEFSQSVVDACIDHVWSEAIENLAGAEAPGYVVSRQKSVGVVYFETPRQTGHSYILIGDPGKGAAPFRNAPALMVWDVTEFPARMVAAWWGNGGGRLDPFIRQLFKFAMTYRVIYIGVDSTGPQSGTVEVINTLVLSPTMEVTNIASSWTALADEVSEIRDKLPPATLMVNGLDFSGQKKTLYLLSTQAVLTGQLMRWPEFFTGMRVQLLNYDKEKDRARNGKLAQDLVAVTCMSAFIIGQIFADYANGDTPVEDGEKTDAHINRDARTNTDVRERRLTR